MKIWIELHRKAVLPFVGAAVAVGVQWVATGTFDRAEIATTIIGLATSLGVYTVPNAHDAR